MLSLLCKLSPPASYCKYFANIIDSLAMILNLSIGEEIEQEASEIEGHHIPAETERTSESHVGDKIEKTQPKEDATSTVTTV